MSRSLAKCLEDGQLTEDEYHTLLAAKERRLVVEILGSQVESTTSLHHMAETVARRKRGNDAPKQSAIDKTAVILHHVHLPKMDKLGVLKYDHDNHRIECGELFCD